MDNTLCCIIDPFSENQLIQYPSGIKESISIGELSIYLPATCYTEGLSKIHFFGPEKYIEGIIEDIDLNNTFSSNTLTYEVN